MAFWEALHCIPLGREADTGKTQLLLRKRRSQRVVFPYMSGLLRKRTRSDKQGHITIPIPNILQQRFWPHLPPSTTVPPSTPQIGHKLVHANARRHQCPRFRKTASAQTHTEEHYRKISIAMPVPPLAMGRLRP